MAMTRAPLLLLAACLFGCDRSHTNSHWAQKSNMEQAKIAFAELDRALQKENSTLWKHSLEGPLIMVDRDTREVIANEKDNAGYLEEKGTFFTGILPKDVIIGNTTSEWAGKNWTMVTLPLPDSKEDRLRLLIHESFHRIQPFVGFDSIPNEDNPHLDTEQGRIFMKLECEALKMALDSKDFNSHLENALLFRSYRHQLFPGSKESENSLELLEGLAEYTGSILGIRTASGLRKNYISMIETFYQMPTYVRSFAYFTIPVYGFYMQQTNPTWNLDIGQETNLTDYIVDFFGFEYPDSIAYTAIREAGQGYGIDSVMASEHRRELKRLETISAYRKRLTGDSITVIDLEDMGIGFNPANLVPLDSLGTVYPVLRVTDNWGNLMVDSGGALLSPRWDRVTISYPVTVSDTLASGVGWQLKLNDPWRLIKTDTKYVLRQNK